MKKTFISFVSQFGIDDLLLLFGAILIIPFAIVNSYCMANPGDALFIPFWATIIIGIISLGLSIYYIYRNLSKQFNKLLFVFLIITLAIVLSNIITTFVQPPTIEFVSMIKAIWLPNYGTFIDTSTNISIEMKFIFVVQFTLASLYIYAGLFLLTRKIKDLSIFIYLSFLLYIALLISIIFSLFTEITKYGDFFNCLFNPGSGISQLPNYSLVSFFSHRNIYAMFIVATICVSLFAHILSKNKYHLIITCFSTIYLLLTFSKMIIIITLIGLLLYFYSYVFLHIKYDKRKMTIIIIITASVIAALILVGIILYNTVDKIYEIIHPLISYTGTMASRISVWETVIEYIQPYWYATGRGYGIGETILHNIGPLVIGEDIPHEHSWFYSMLSKGGILLVAVFILFVCYFTYLFAKTLIRKKYVVLPLCLGFVIFFAQAFFESSYYMLFVFAALLLCVANNSTDVDGFYYKKHISADII